MFLSVCLCLCVCVCVCVCFCERERESEFTVFLRLNFPLKILVSEMVIVNSLFRYCLNFTSPNSCAGHTCAMFSGVRSFCEC
jgi:hypothetical protein